MSAAAVLCASLSGCLLPQDYPYLETEPAELLRPPRILDFNVEPSTVGITIEDDSTCDKIRFSINAQDDDIDRVLYVNFYEDQRPDSLAVKTISPTGTVIRSQGASYDMDPRQPARAINTLGVHVVEAVLGNAPFNARTECQSSPSAVDFDPNRPLCDSYAWFVDVKQVCK
jgi:hypothetical protein